MTAPRMGANPPYRGDPSPCVGRSGTFETLVDVIAAAGDQALARSHFQGRRKGAVQAIAAPGWTLDIVALHHFRVADGRLVERWTPPIGNLSMLKQARSIFARPAVAVRWNVG